MIPPLLLPLIASSAAFWTPPPTPGDGAAPARRPNVLLIVLDDVGIRELEVYGEGSDYPALPNITELAARGVRFDNLWTSPGCSPTRASLLTGRYAQRTKVGKSVSGGGQGLGFGEVALPAMLPEAYSSALVGKWHLSSVADPLTAPNGFGFDYFAGIRFNLGAGEGYYDWPRVEQGVETQSNEYITSVQIDDARNWIAAQSGPWFCSLNLTAGHGPWEEYPPAALHGESPGNPDYGMPRSIYRAMLEAADAELGRLLRVVSLQDTYVFLMGDDGTPKPVIPLWAQFDTAKGTVFEGGVNVPLIVAGPWVDPGVCDALLHTVDFAATVATITGGRAPTAVDSLSFAPHLLNPELPSLRGHNFADFFGPNGDGPYTTERYAVRNERYKLIRVNGTEQLFDLTDDPKEQVNLIDQSSLAAVAEGLRAELDAYLAIE